MKEKSPLRHGHDLIHNKIKLWHPADEPIIGKDTDGWLIHTMPNSFSLPGKELLDPDVLQCFDIGSSRVCTYFKHNNIDIPYEVNCSEKDVLLTRILATSDTRKAKVNKAIVVVTLVVEV